MDNYENYELTDEQWKRIQPLLPPEYTETIFSELNKDADTENLSIDSTCVNIHESSNGGKNGR